MLWDPGISIEMKGERPKARLKLVITTDEETSEHEIEKAEPTIEWFGKLCEHTSPSLCTY